MSHIPRRATQHGIFMPSHEVVPTSLKPGQASMQRQVYVEEAKTLEDNFLQQDRPTESAYSKLHSSHTKPQDYMEPTKPIKPTAAPGGGGHWNTAHWRSEYRSSMDDRSIDGAKYHRQFGPSYQATNPPTCVGAAALVSAYHEEFGTKGSDPRQRVRPDADRMPVFRTGLTPGTHKGTHHIPGYSGFLPTNTRNPYVARVESGANMRSTDKTNLVQVYHTNLPGYHGHKATHVTNDRGGMPPTTSSTTGKDFQPPPLAAFA